MASNPIEFELFLGRAGEHERKHNWLGAADLYSTALLEMSHLDLQRVVELEERHANALFRAAMQAEDVSDFKDKIQLAKESYERLSQTHRESGPVGEARALRCLAMTRQLSFWLTDEISEKIAFLEDCCKLTNGALRAFEELGEKTEFGTTYNGLAWALMLAATFDPELQSRQMRVKEAITQGEKAVAFLTRGEDKTEASRAGANVSVFLMTYAEYLAADFEELAFKEQKALAYWNKAQELSEETAFLTSWTISIVADTNAGWKIGTKETLKLFGKTLEYAKATRDRLIVGSICNWLSYNLSWASNGTADPSEAIRLREEATRYYRDANSHFEAIGHLNILQDPEPNHWMGLAELEEDPDKRKALLDKAVESSRRGMAAALRSGHGAALFYAHVSLGRSLTSLGKIEPYRLAKTKLLEEALAQHTESLRLLERFAPYYYYDQGFLLNLIASIRLELAGLAGDSETRTAKLQEVIADKEAGILLCEKGLPMVERHGPIGVFARTGSLQSELGDLLIRLSATRERASVKAERQSENGDLQTSLHAIEDDDQQLRNAAKAFENAAKSFQKSSLETRMAECYWKAAQTYDALGEHRRASERFSLASNSYKNSAEKIPALTEFYMDHASYMEAWSEIEKARHCHERQEYGSAKRCYEKAEELLASTHRWNYLGSHYSGLSNIESAESLSSKGEAQRAAKVFTHGASLFAQSSDMLKRSLYEMESNKGAQITSDLIRASEIRGAYCTARSCEEEAKLLLRQGDGHASAEKFCQAAQLFESILPRIESEKESREFGLGAKVSKAWQMVAQAEEEASPSLYLEASRLFEEAKELASNKSVRMLMLGNSRFCKALETGSRFLESADPSCYSSTMKDLDTASGHYQNAGFARESNYAEGTELLFEGYYHIEAARREQDQEKKRKSFSMAEEVLTMSANLYTRSGYKTKRKQVLGLIEKAKKGRKRATTLQEILRGPRNLPATAALPSTAHSFESATGLEDLESAKVIGILRVPEGPIYVGSSVKIEMELVNAGKTAATLIKLDSIVREGLEFQGPATIFDAGAGAIDLRGKKLEPLVTFHLEFELKPLKAGTFSISPVARFVDDKGTYMTHKIAGVSLTVGEPIREQVSPVMMFLGSAFVEDYMVKRLTADYAGWRTLMDIVDTLQIPKAQIYGDARYGHTFGRSLETLVKRGLVEYRIVPGARGRGGNVMKVRVAYDKEPVKKIVNELALEPTKNGKIVPLNA